VYKSFYDTYEAVGNCLRLSMKCKVGKELGHYLKSLLKSKRVPKRVGGITSRQEKKLANELRRFGLIIPVMLNMPTY